MFETLLAYAAGCLTGGASILLLAAFVAGRRNAGITPTTATRAWRHLPATRHARIYGTFTINGHSRD